MRSPWLSALLAFVSLACSTADAKAPPATAAQTATVPGAATGGAKQGDELLGTRPHEWTVDTWMNSTPLTLASLRGRVVLVRWFMSTDCPLCSATAPSLRALDAEYRAQGLSVIGFYHHKDEGPLDPSKVATYVKRYGYTFPVAIDRDWRTLHDWWLDGHERDYTSVSFLLDKTGTIRFIHPGGKYEPGGADERELRAKVLQLLAE